MPPNHRDPVEVITSSDSASHPAGQRFLVCLGPNSNALELVETGRKMAEGVKAEWYALFIDTPSHTDGTRSDREHAVHSLQVAESWGAKTFKVSGLVVAAEIINFARQNGITTIFLGRSKQKKWYSRLTTSLVTRLLRGLEGVDIYLVASENTAPQSNKRLPLQLPRFLKGYVLAVAGVILCTVLAFGVFYYLPLSNLVMFYLLTMVIIATVSERGPTILASLLSIGLFAFFFVTRYFSFWVENVEYTVTLLMMLVVATLISGLTARARYQAKVAREQEWQTTALYDMNQALLGKSGLEELLAAAVEQISRLFDSRVSILLPHMDDLEVRAGEPLPQDDVREGMVAQWVFKNNCLAGAGTQTLPQVKGLYMPLKTANRQVLGVLRLERRLPSTGKYVEVEYLRLLEALGHQIALALERASLSQQTRRAQLQVEAERFRNTLLSSVSHDLRTPLTVIAGSASSLLEAQENLDDKIRLELIQTIYEEAKRLDLVVQNLLEISRLQSGEIRINKEWHVLEEVIGCALSQLEGQLKQHSVTINLPQDLPLVQMDALLIERVFINLLENASKYTPPGTKIEISGALEPEALHLVVADQGPGLPPGQEERIFEKFYQARPGAIRGAGLGLAICRCIIEAHDGQINAVNRPEGGAAFHFTLPFTGDQPDWQEPMLDLEQETRNEA